MKLVKEMGIVAVCLLLLGFGICMGVGTFLMYRDGEQEYDALREYVAVEEPKERKDGETPDEDAEETVTVHFEALKKINPEIIAWIRIQAMISGFIFFRASKCTVTVSSASSSGVSPSFLSFGSSTATYSRRASYSCSPSLYMRNVPTPIQIPKPSSKRHTATIPISFTSFINFLHFQFFCKKKGPPQT